MTAPGLVSLVGAGPGDPALLTRRAHRRLREADVVFYDGLVPRAIVRQARRARLVSVARRAGPKHLSHEAVIDEVVREARAGRRVVRLKAGDPFVFGRGHEEISALEAAGVAHEIVPGLTSATAGPALAGIPLTRRGVASSFLVLSGHAPAAYRPLLAALPAGAATIVVLMGLRERRAIARCLIDAGWPATMPAAIVTSASQPSQRVWAGMLGRLAAAPDSVVPGSPGVIVIGEVAACAAARGRRLDRKERKDHHVPA